MVYLVAYMYHTSNNSLEIAEFDKLSRMIQRQHNLSEPVPVFYVRTLVNLETSINTALQKEKEAKKKMNVSNAKALTAMKQKIKKAIKECEADVKRYQEVSDALWITLHFSDTLDPGSRGI